MKGIKAPPVVRFWEHVRVEPSGCWIWTARTPKGYGQFMLSPGHPVRAHRWSYEQAHGPIPTGLEIDHLCRVTTCVNPGHLEAVTQRENSLRSMNFGGINARKTHCIRGHPFDEANTYSQGNGRKCRACALRWYHLNKKLLEQEAQR